MKKLQRIITLIAISCIQLTAMQQQQHLSSADKTALELIGAMQASIKLYQPLEKQTKTQAVVADINNIKNVFAQSLEQYLIKFGQAFEKQGGLMSMYKTNYHIASQHNPEQAITPDEHAILLETLQQAAKLNDWGSTINVTLSVAKNGILHSRTLTLHEVINAIKQVPLPSNYSISSMLTTGAALAALAIGGYFVTQAWQQYHNKPIANLLQHTKPAVEEPKIIATSALLADAQAEQTKLPLTSETEEIPLTPEQIEEYREHILEQFILTHPEEYQKLQEIYKKEYQAAHKPHDPHDDGRFSTFVLNAIEKRMPSLPESLQPQSLGGKIIFNVGKEFTVGMLTHTAKTIMDLPGNIYDLASHVTQNIMNPSPQLQAQTDQYLESLEQMTPQQLQEHYQEEGGIGSTELDKKLSMELAGQALGTTGGAWVAQGTKNLALKGMQKSKSLINPQQAAKDQQTAKNMIESLRADNKPVPSSLRRTAGEDMTLPSSPGLWKSIQRSKLTPQQIAQEKETAQKAIANLRAQNKTVPNSLRQTAEEDIRYIRPQGVLENSSKMAGASLIGIVPQVAEPATNFGTVYYQSSPKERQEINDAIATALIEALSGEKTIPPTATAGAIVAGQAVHNYHMNKLPIKVSNLPK